MGKPNCHAKAELKKGPWTREEDQKLLAYIDEHGHGSWRSLPAKAGLQRCGKSCRLRWTNYLRPDIKRGKFSTHEEKTIIRLHALLGNRWSAIAAYLPKRTDNEIKNYWNTRLKKRLTRMGIDPVTHKPKNNPGGSAQSRHAADLSHMAQWETARLEAEARLARESKILTNLHLFQKAAVTARRHPPPPLLPPHVAAAPCLDVLKVCQATSNRFFGSTAAAPSLDSPTSTLNFSSNIRTAVPPVKGSSVVGSDVVSANDYGSACTRVEENYVSSYAEVIQGKMENPLMQLHCDINMHSLANYHVPNYDYDIMTVANQDSEGYNNSGPNVGEFEDSKNYWNELLSFVSSPMENMGIS